MSREEFINKLIKSNSDYGSLKDKLIKRVKYIPVQALENMEYLLSSYKLKPLYFDLILEYMQEYYISKELKIRQENARYLTDIEKLKQSIRSAEIAGSITNEIVIPRREAEILSDMRLFFELEECIDIKILPEFFKHCFSKGKLPSPSMEHVERKEKLLSLIAKMRIMAQAKREELGSDKATRDFYRKKFRQ